MTDTELLNQFKRVCDDISETKVLLENKLNALTSMTNALTEKDPNIALIIKKIDDGITVKVDPDVKSTLNVVNSIKTTVDKTLPKLEPALNDLQDLTADMNELLKAIQTVEAKVNTNLGQVIVNNNDLSTHVAAFKREHNDFAEQQLQIVKELQTVDATVKTTVQNFIANLTAVCTMLEVTVAGSLQVSTDTNALVSRIQDTVGSLKMLTMQTGEFQLWLSQQMDTLKNATVVVDSVVEALCRNMELKEMYTEREERKDDLRLANEGLHALLDVISTGTDLKRTFTVAPSR